MPEVDLPPFSRQAAIEQAVIGSEDYSVAFIYDGSLEGLLSAVFSAYESHVFPHDVSTRTDHMPRLGQRIVEIDTSLEHAVRVQRGIIRSCGDRSFEALRCAALSDVPDRGGTILRFVRYGLQLNQASNCAGCPKRGRCRVSCGKLANTGALSNIAVGVVGDFVRLAKSVENERHLMLQFLRFEHLEGDVWFARCNPKASVVPLVMDYFAARFNTMDFMIYDEVHHMAGIFEGCGWYLVRSDDITTPEHAHDEELMQAAWKRFYDSVSIEARYHPELRRQFMPKRLWKNLTEMQIDPKESHLQEFNDPR